MREETSPTGGESPPIDDTSLHMQNMRIASDDDGSQGNEQPSPTQRRTGPIKVDIKPEDPNETPYEVITNRVFVGGFPLNTSEEEVRKTFGQWGEIIDVKIIRKEVQGQTKGYGFVTYANDDDAEVVRGKENVKINGKKLNLGPAMRRLYSTLREVKEAQRSRDQLLSDGTDSPSTTNGTPPVHNNNNSHHTHNRRIHGGGNGHYPSRRYYNKRNRTYDHRRNNQPAYFDDGFGKPAPLMSLDMTPMYIAPFDLNKAISSNNEFQFLQCTVPMSDHTLPAAIRQQFDAQFDSNHHHHYKGHY